ncbi:MAG: type II toxin-antitoxin system VapC family toxin [Candidatus Latescibacteria bacterium]|nr:type II toxin-antitoxin system VapC family toxin [Candidatus Latescibacterota bacterium]
MTVKLFIDTWGWLTLRDRGESRHEEVKAFYAAFVGRRGVGYTTDYVLDETFTLLFRRLPFQVAKASLELLDRSIREGYLTLERISRERFDKAKALRLKLHDKPRISFTDLTSMVTMAECAISDVLTEDDHFSYIGMGFRKVP